MADIGEQRITDWTPDPRPLAIAGIRAALEPGIEAGRYPGAQVYASRHGEVLADLGLGEARLGTAMTPETIVSWQCNTKPVVGVAVAQLCERGLLDVDTPVARYLPGFEANGKQAVTPRHLLTHTARFGPLTGYPAGGRPTRDEFEAILRNLELIPDWPLGRKAKYTMLTGYGILGAVIRRVDGRHLTDYVREEIFGPLAMGDCWIGVDPAQVADVADRMAFLYDTQGARPEIPLMMGGVAEGRDLEVGTAGAGGIGPMRELAQLYESLLASLRGDRDALLRRESIAAMLERPALGDGALGPWALGVFAAPGFFGKWFPAGFGHEGLQFSMVVADPDTGIVVSAMVNGLARGGSLTELTEVGRAVHDAVAAAA
jgi:CubicO group peptidase (beta-lactamase class C family)